MRRQGRRIESHLGGDAMQHRCKVTVIDKKCFPEYQEKYLADPKSGPCPFYHVGDEFVFYRYADEDTFWTMGRGQPVRGGMGLHQPLHLHRPAGRQHHAALDQRREDDDRLLQRRNEAGHLQDRAPGLQSRQAGGGSKCGEGNKARAALDALEGVEKASFDRTNDG